MRQRTLPPDARELEFVRRATALRSAGGEQAASWMNANGASHLWLGEARDLRRSLGAWKGWRATTSMLASMTLAAARSDIAKRRVFRARPFAADEGVRMLGSVPHGGSSMPSGHTAVARAAADTLSRFAPQHAATYDSWARAMGRARIASGVHYPSDVHEGARIGAASARWFRWV